MRIVEVTTLPGVDALAWPGLAEGLRREGAPRLLLAPLAGGALSLGRWQRADLALRPEALGKPRTRRPSGGRTIVTGEGVTALALALPHRDWLTGEGVPAASFLNRAVRFVLRGLARLGVVATYGGRDFVTVGGGQAVYASFDVGPDGHALFEAYLAGAAHWWAGGHVTADLAPGRGFPPPGHLPAPWPPEVLLRALSDGLHEAYGLATDTSVAAVAPAPLGLVPGERAWAPIEGAAVDAQVSVSDVDGMFITGDVLADSAGMKRLSEGADADEMQRIFRDPAHALLGVRDLGSVARAMAAARGGR